MIGDRGHSTPDHPVGSRWVWKEDGEADTLLTVVKVTPKTCTMRADEGWTVKFGDKHRALTSGRITRVEVANVG